MILLLGVQVQDTIRNRGIICKMIAMCESVKETYDQGTTCKEADIKKIQGHNIKVVPMCESVAETYDQGTACRCLEPWRN